MMPSLNNRCDLHRCLEHLPGYLLLIILPAIFACQKAKVSATLSDIHNIKPLIITTIPHDTSAFTQGLLFHDGYLFESTGLYGMSSVRRIDVSNGSIIKTAPLNGRLFGEGLALSGENLIQLTWRENMAIVYRLNDLSFKGNFEYSGEGWGLTVSPEGYVMSNGGDTLFIRDEKFNTIRTVPVSFKGKPLRNINELEFARGILYANVWYSNYIFEIDMKKGRVIRLIDCSEIIAKAGAAGSEDVLNGIAYNQSTDRFYITGKRWPLIFEIDIASSASSNN